MIDKQTALYLVEEAFDQGNPTMVHGTSVEAVIDLLKNGRLPSSFYPGVNDHPSKQGYLFFVPIKKSFAGHPLYDKIKIDLDGGKLVDDVRYYAEDIQGRRFLIDTLGYWPDDASPEEFEPFGPWSLEDLERIGVNTVLMKEYGLRRLYGEVKKRKGVCLGINENIFEMEIHSGCDDPGEEVMIHLPNGLDIKYVQYIFPFGDLEKKALYGFIAGLPEKK